MCLQDVKMVCRHPKGEVLISCSLKYCIKSGVGKTLIVCMCWQDVKMVCWHPKEEVLVSCSYDDSIKVWVEDDREWECAQTLAGPGLGHSSTVWGVAFDASGQRMVSCSDDLTLKIWACHFDNPGMSCFIVQVLCNEMC